jgi:hypothetical protein
MEVQHVQCATDGQERKIAKVLQAYGFDHDLQNPRFELVFPNLDIRCMISNNIKEKVNASTNTNANANHESMILNATHMTIESDDMKVKSKGPIEIEAEGVFHCNSSEVKFKPGKLLSIAGTMHVF